MQENSKKQLMGWCNDQFCYTVTPKGGLWVRSTKVIEVRSDRNA